MADYKQLSFAGGMDLLSSPTDMASTAYRAAFNIRTRYGKLQNIPKSTNITYNLLGAGQFQGIYAIENIWICFMGGKAYWMFVGGTSWSFIPGIQLDTGVGYIYACAVPASTNTFFRQAVSNNANAGVIFNPNPPFAISGTPSGIVVQDGINQPCFIIYDSVAGTVVGRTLQTFDEWNNDGLNFGQEYVPVGTLMFYSAPILYIVNGNQIYRSVSGAPLNFMLNVDVNGNKLSSEALGGAATTSFAISFDAITNISSAPAGTGSAGNLQPFLVGTNRNITIIQPDLTTTIFGEPTFDNIGTIEAGVVNQFSMTNSNGDTPFIDFEGVIFFNAVKTLKFEGRNDIRSKNLAQALQGLTQNICCCTVFDNYNLFALNSNYGYVIAVYDNMTNMFVGFDLTLACAGGIKMFAEANIPGERFLAAGNASNQIWLLMTTEEGDSNRECGTVFLREFISGSYTITATFIYNLLTIEQKINFVKVLVNQGTVAGTLYVRTYVDNEFDMDETKTLPAAISSIPYIVRPAVIPSSLKRIRNMVFTLDQGNTGYQVQPMLSWTGDADIYRVDMNTTEIGKQQSQGEQQSMIFNGGN